LELNNNNQLLKNNIAVSERRQALIEQMKDKKTAGEWISLSLKFYQEGMYQSCVDACELSLKQKPDNPIAYNNICSAYNALEQWDNAAKAGEKAVELDPESQLARNNLALAKKNLKK